MNAEKKQSAGSWKKKKVEPENDPFPVIPAAKLIFLAGLKGERVGDVEVSQKHTNFIVNLGRGRAEDVNKLMEIIRKEIENKFGVFLEEEIMYV